MCTAAIIINLLGYMPPPGTLVSIPASAVGRYSVMKVAAAKTCARRYGIRWRIIEDR